MKIKKGDQVKIISGKDRGKRGKVLSVFVSKRKLLVEGLNVVKRHRRPRKEGEKGQRVEVPAPIDISNVMLICPNCGKPARIGYKIENNSKFRICRKCKGEIN